MSDKYAKLEIERRFALAAAPSGLSQPRRIVDCYISGTRLRLRIITDAEGAVVRKLGHKVPIGGAVSQVMHTTVYLDEREFSLLQALPAATLAKTRYRVQEHSGWAVDVYDGILAGLITAEVECVDEQTAVAVACPWPGLDVTDDPRFSGVNLAAADPWAAHALIAALAP